MLGSYNPWFVLNAAFHSSPSWILMLLYPHQTSSFVKSHASCTLSMISGINRSVTITPYLSRDTTYCYRHCKGILHFPLLLHHSLPRPMPDRIASASLTIHPHHTTLIGLMPRNPITCTASWTALFPWYLHPFSPRRHYDVWLRPRLGPYPFHDIIAYRPPTIRPLPLTLTIHTAIRYWLIPLAWWTFPFISDVLYNAMTHLGLRRWLRLVD